jgi:hypothetical protein
VKEDLKYLARVYGKWVCAVVILAAAGWLLAAARGAWSNTESWAERTVKKVRQFASGSRQGDAIELFVILLNGKAGYIDKAARIVIQPQFRSARPFSEGLAAVEVETGDRGYIDQTGHPVIAPQFFHAEDFSNGLALVGKLAEDYREMYIDKSGKVAITLTQLETGRIRNAHSPSRFSEGLAAVDVWDGEHSETAYINAQGQIAIMPQFERGYDFNEGVAQVYRYGDSKTALIDKSGRLITDYVVTCPPLFQGQLQFSEGYAAQTKQCFGKWGFVDKSLNFVIEPQFSSVSVFREDLAAVGFERIPALQSPDRGNYFSGIQTFGDWGLNYPDLNYGYTHKSGVLVIPAQFEGAGVFSEGLAAVKLHGRCGYIDKSGRMVITPRFDAAHPFSHGLAHVRVGERWGYINVTGTYVWNPTS